MKKKIGSLLIVFVLLLSCLSVEVLATSGDLVQTSTAETLLYVSPNGNDITGDGSESKPFATIMAARDAVRRLNDNMRSDIHVIIANGTYIIENTIEFNIEDSASNGYRISYEAAEGATPVISGGKTIAGWSKVIGSDNIYQASVPEGMDFRQLYVNGKKATRARNTEVGTEDTAYKKLAWVEPYQQPASDTITTEACLYIETGDIPADMDLDELAGAEIHEIISWTSNVLRIAKAELTPNPNHDAQSANLIKLTLEEPESRLIFNRPHPYIGYYYGDNNGLYPYYLDNAYGLLDQPGEWYLDRNSNTLYYKPEANENMDTATVVAPAVETLLDVQGNLKHKVEGLTFKGLTFQHSNWVYPSDNGFVDSQCGLPVVSANLKNEIGIIRPSAAIHIACAEELRFEKNIITDIGNMAALDLEYGTTNCVVKNNIVTEVAGNGIMIAKFTQNPGDEYHHAYNPSDVQEYCNGDKILNNTITYTGMEYEGSAGILGGYPRNLTVANNLVAYVPYSGICVGYGWTSAENAMANNIIARNEVHHYAQRANDAGGIYTLSYQPDSWMFENYIHTPDTSNYLHSFPYGAIYLDEATNGYMLVRNVAPDQGLNIHTGGNNPQVKNLFWCGDISENAAAQEISNAAGPQTYLENTDEILPMKPVVETATAIGDFAELRGAFQGSSDEVCVVFTGEKGTITQSEILEQTRDTIRCWIPDGVVAGIVYVKMGEQESNRDVLLCSDYVATLVSNEDFEKCEIGEFTETENWKQKSDGSGVKSTVVDLPDNHKKAIKAASDGSNGGIVTTKNVDVYKLQFDFYFPKNPDGWQGIYSYSSNGDEVSILPGYGNAAIGLRKVSNSGTRHTGSRSITEGQWYTCVLSYEGQKTRVKVWKTGEAEPDVWDVSVDGAGSNTAGKVRLEYYAWSAEDDKCVYFDNIKIWGEPQPVLERPAFRSVEPVTVVTAIGNEPVLPKNVVANYDDGRSISLRVHWESISPGDYQQTGTIVVAGTIEGITAQATCTIHVLPAAVRENFENEFDMESNLFWEGSETVSIDEMDGNHVANVASYGANGRLVSKVACDFYELQFDLFFNEEQSDYTGLYAYIYPEDGGIVPEICITPAYYSPMRIEKVSSGISSPKVVPSKTWYTVKIAFENDNLCVKAWEQGTEEPTAWDMHCALKRTPGKIEIGYYGNGKSMLVDNIVVKLLQAKQVTATPGTGTYSAAQKIVLASETPNATIYYTIDGTEPTCESNIYDAPILVEKNATIKAVAISEDYAKSEIASFTYVIEENQSGGNGGSTSDSAVIPGHTHPASKPDSNLGSFTDVKSTDWFAEAVQYAADNGLMNGTAEMLFSPYGDTTRGMIVTILYRQAGSPHVVSDGAAWWSDARVWAMKVGISDGTHMDAIISREQLAAMLYRYAGSPEVSGNIKTFADAGKVSVWAEKAMIWAVENGIITGKTDGMIDPKAGALRAETAMMFMRFFGLNV